MDFGVDTRKIRRKLNKIDLLVATSDTTASLLSASFHLDASKIVVTGQPRCDALFNPLDYNILNAVLKTKNDSKLVLFMPTFRQGLLQRTEGRIFSIHNIFSFERFDDKAFKEFLINNDIVFICKLHPFEEKLFIDKFSEDDNHFLLISNKTLEENNIDLYRLIGTVDLLITDYSSVYFDYLLLNKPMVFIPTDIKEYEKKRGFLVEPYDFWTPGPKATTQEQLQNEILKSLKKPDYYRKERETINNIINHYKDARSCERVTQVIMERLNQKKMKKR